MTYCGNIVISNGDLNINTQKDTTDYNLQVYFWCKSYDRLGTIKIFNLLHYSSFIIVLTNTKLSRHLSGFVFYTNYCSNRLVSNIG